jgi:hypothetical protein
MPVTSSPSADGVDSIGAGASEHQIEIEITPEMIEAGMEEYGGRWLGLRDADDDVAREMLRSAYAAMYRLRPLQIR